MAAHQDTPVKNHSDHFIESLSKSQRNHLRVLLHSERGMTDLRISLNSHKSYDWENAFAGVQR